MTKAKAKDKRETVEVLHAHCWHARFRELTDSKPMHCCYCNADYVAPPIPMTTTTVYHGPYA